MSALDRRNHIRVRESAGIGFRPCPAPTGAGKGCKTNSRRLGGWLASAGRAHRVGVGGDPSPREGGWEGPCSRKESGPWMVRKGRPPLNGGERIFPLADVLLGLRSPQGPCDPDAARRRAGADSGWTQRGLSPRRTAPAPGGGDPAAVGGDSAARLSEGAAQGLDRGNPDDAGAARG